MIYNSLPARRLVFALALLCAGLGIYIYQQQSKLADAEALIRSLQAKTKEVAATPAHADGAEALDNSASPELMVEGGAEEAGPKDQRRGGKPRRGFGDYAQMMDTPEMQQLMNLRDRGMLDSRYAELFKNLGLPPAQLQKFQQLLIDKQSTFRDVLAAMRTQGLTPNRDNADQMRTLVQNANVEIDRQIQSTLGTAAYEQYQNYELTQPQRATVERMQQRLSYSGEPMTPQQATSLVGILSQNTAPTVADAALGRPRGGNYGAGNGSGGAITPQAIDQSRAILSPGQVNTLIAIQQEKDAQAQLARQMRQNMSAVRMPAAPKN